MIFLHISDVNLSGFISCVYRRLLVGVPHADLSQLAANIQNKQLKNMGFFVELLWE